MNHFIDGQQIDGIAKVITSNPLFGVEVGVYAGDLSAQLLRQYPNLTLGMVDRWEVVDPSSAYAKTRDSKAALTADQWGARYQDAIDHTAFAANRRRIIRGDGVSDEVLRQITNRSLDFVFLDADHSASGTLAAIIAWMEKVRPGGVICGDDYRWPADRNFGVIEAVYDVMSIRRQLRSSFRVTDESVWAFRVP